MKVEGTVRIESIKKVFNLKLDKTELSLALKVGSKNASLLREFIDTATKKTWKIDGPKIEVVSAWIENIEVTSGPHFGKFFWEGNSRFAKHKVDKTTSMEESNSYQ